MFSRSIKPTTMRSEYLPPWVYLEQHHLFKKVSNSVWMKKDSSLSCFNLEQKLNPTKDKEICFNGKCILSLSWCSLSLANPFPQNGWHGRGGRESKEWTSCHRIVQRNQNLKIIVSQNTILEIHGRIKYRNHLAYLQTAIFLKIK